MKPPKVVVVYMTQTISTIVDEAAYLEGKESLYDPNNFYYCRYKQELIDIKGLYDPNNFYYCRYERTTTSAMSVYMTQTISTIVDFVNYARRINSLQGIVQIILTLLSCFGVKLLNFV